MCNIDKIIHHVVSTMLEDLIYTCLHVVYVRDIYERKGDLQRYFEGTPPKRNGVTGGGTIPDDDLHYAICRGQIEQDMTFACGRDWTCDMCVLTAQCRVI